MFSHALSYYKYHTGGTILYDLRCNAGGARPIKVSNEYGTRPWTEHHAQLYMRLTKVNNMVNTR